MIHKFHGEEKIFCKKLGSVVTDIGLIYLREKISAEMKFVTISKEQNLFLRSGIHYIFCSSGICKIANYNLSVGDTLRIDTPQNLQIISLDSKSEFIFITIMYL